MRHFPGTVNGRLSYASDPDCDMTFVQRTLRATPIQMRVPS